MDSLNLPKTFVDDAGRSWTVTIKWSTCKRIEDVAGVVVDDLISTKAQRGGNPVAPFQALITDFWALSKVLYAILKPQCDALTPPLSLEDFQDAIVGNAVTAARDAFVQALYDFFPDPRKSLLGSAAGIGKKTEAKAMKTMDVEMEKLSAAATTRIDEQMASIDLVKAFNDTLGPLKTPSSAAPASAVLTPIPGPSGS